MADLERYFATRALAAAVVAGALAVAGVLALRSDARYVYDGLTSDGLPLVIASLVCGVAALVLVGRRAHRGVRPLAVGAVVLVVPSLALLYTLAQRSLIEETASPAADASAGREGAR